jgi:hypothetical protein
MSTAETSLPEQLRTYRQGFLDRKQGAEGLIDGAPDDLLATPPAPDAWSVLQCLDHLNTTGWLLLERLEPALHDAMEHGPHGTPPFRYGLVSRWFVKAMRPDSRFSIPAPPSYAPDPAPTLRPSETIQAFLSLQDTFAGCILHMSGVDLRAVRVGSPAFPLMRISAGAWIEATLAHEDRHLQQAQRALQTVRAAAAS